VSWLKGGALGDKLKWKIDDHGGALRISLSGPIDEDAAFSAISKKLVSGRAILDMSGISRWSSIGLSAWYRLTESLHARGVEVVLERCSPPTVHQINMLLDFLRYAQIRSIVAPYECATCGHEQGETIELQDRVQVKPTLRCPKCGSDAELTEIPEQYLEFLWRK
jgi:DNA-directed RNA polymerase subunit RPC12/RpoP